jgi:Prenyltransferase and squalene oxidase repeat
VKLVRAIVVLLAACGLQAQPEIEIRRAAERALKPIERSMATFAKERACFSCHHNGLGILALREASLKGLAVSIDVLDQIKAKTLRPLQQPRALQTAIEAAEFSDPTPNDSLLLLAGGRDVGYPDVPRVIQRRIATWQEADGHWGTSDFRPPHSYSAFTATALAVAALNGNPEHEARLARAGEWLLAHNPESTEDAAFRLMGLAEIRGMGEDGIRRAADDLVAMQLPSGGWPQIKGYVPDAYSTGQAVYALRVVRERSRNTSAAEHRGLAFLIRTQAADGTWRTHSRMLSPAHVSPPYFKTGYPYGKDEFLSFAGACWALRAMSAALPVPKGGIDDCRQYAALAPQPGAVEQIDERSAKPDSGGRPIEFDR